MELDKTDYKILAILQDDARMTNADLADKVALSPAACHKRVKRLENAGVLKAYHAVIDRSAVGYSQSAFVQITLDSQGRDAIETFERSIIVHPQIVACHLMMGDYDYLLQVVFKDAQEYEVLHRDVLTSLPRVSRLITRFALRTVRGDSLLPL